MLTAQHSKSRMNRYTLVIILATVLVFLGSLILTATVTWYDAKPRQHSMSEMATLWATTHVQEYETPVGTAASTPGSTSRLTPPIPFPTQLWQQQAVLQSQNRFLFNGSRSLPEIALTFDDGPNPDYTPQILAILQNYGIKATFFCIGQQVKEYPDIVKQEYADGHVIGNHSWSHPNMGLLTSDAILRQINRTSDIIQETIGVRPTFFRPPYGVFDANVLAQANQLDMTTVIWNDEAQDWYLPGVNVIINRILGLAWNGSIILLHDGGGNRAQTVAALPSIITSLRAQGYKFVTLQQMVNDLPKHPAASQAPAAGPSSISPSPTFTPEPSSSGSPTPMASPTPTFAPTVIPTPSAFIIRRAGVV